MKDLIIPNYPNSAPITLDMQEDLDSILSKNPDGLSEFSFLNMYLFKDTYNYSVSLCNGELIILGSYHDEPFFACPVAIPPSDVVQSFLKDGMKWALISESFYKEHYDSILNELKDSRLNVEEDRDNFDYLYLTESLAKLEGKDLHKKKTHINKFEKSYTNIKIEELTKYNAKDALKILEEWKKSAEEHKTDTDYNEALTALSLLKDARIDIKGIVLYVEDVPVAWTLAELIKDTALVLFEKALPQYKGGFQYVNYAFAGFLDTDILYINREQDLGDAGLRQAKMTYRPIRFIKKYKVQRKVCQESTD